MYIQLHSKSHILRKGKRTYNLRLREYNLECQIINLFYSQDVGSIHICSLIPSRNSSCYSPLDSLSTVNTKKNSRYQASIHFSIHSTHKERRATNLLKLQGALHLTFEDVKVQNSQVNPRKSSHGCSEPYSMRMLSQSPTI